MAKPKLTPKQAKFVEGVVKGKTKTEAYKDAYDVSPDTKIKSIREQASVTSTIPQVKEALDKALAKHQITIERAVKPISDALDATRDFYDKEGNYIDSTADHNTRLKASGMALKLLGAEQGENKGTTIIFNKGDIVKSKYIKD